MNSMINQNYTTKSHNAFAAYQYEGKTQRVSAQETTFAEKVSETEKTGGVAELSEADRLEAFKKEIWDQINSYPWNPSISESIQITDGAFKRMMEDSDFKDRMLDVLYRDAIAGRPPICAGITWIDESGYRGFSYNDKTAGEIAFQAHSNHKDTFFVHKAKNKDDLNEIWLKRQQKRQEQRELLDEKYERTRYLNSVYKHKADIAKLYEEKTVVNPIIEVMEQ